MSDQSVDEKAEPFELTAAPENEGQRLDAYLAGQIPAISRNRIKTLIKSGEVRLGGRKIEDPSYRVNAGDGFLVNRPEPLEADPEPENIPLVVVYEDDDVIVIDKPAGMVVHPAAGHWQGTLVNALLFHCGDSLSGIGGVKRPGIVHRLDKDTTGLLVVAKNDRAHKSLAAQFADHGRTGPLERAYQALVWGAPPQLKGTIDAPLFRSTANRQKIAVVREGGRRAVTHWQVKERFGPKDRDALVSRVECRLETGRTHQIRVHMAHIGHPLIGDVDYGAHFKTKISKLPKTSQAAAASFDRQALHAGLLAFEHPISGETMRFESPLPEDFEKLLATLRIF